MNDLIDACSSMLNNLESLSQNITTVLHKFQMHNDKVKTPCEVLLSKVTENELLEQEICYKLWFEKIESIR